MAIAEKPTLATVKLGNLEVSRFILGGNPQSAYSHWDGPLDREMRHCFTGERMKALLRRAERAGR